MERSNPSKNNLYCFDDVTLDCENFTVQKGGRNIDIKPRTFDVLIYLAKNPGRVVTKQEIFDEIWRDTFVGDNALAKIISEIRHALSDETAQPRYIETVPTRGYRFIGELKEQPRIEVPGARSATHETTRPTPSRPGSNHFTFTNAALIVGIISVTAFAAWLLFDWVNLGKNSSPIRSIAVMPFVYESGDGNIEYLSDGMTETLISSLTQLPNLNVKARSTVFRYKGKETDPKTIGKELNVQAVLTGRVVGRGDQLTLSLELVDVQTENAVWSQQYNRKQTDLIALQSEIAHDVSSKLRTRLSGADEAKLNKTSTTDPEAYQLYLRGRFHWNKRTPEGLRQAVEFFDRAIAKDPNYALAHSGLAETYVLYSFYGIGSPKESMPQAKAAARRALEIDDSLAEAHVAFGLYNCLFAWNNGAAEKEFRRAIELTPNYASAHQQLGNCCLLGMGRFDEAVAEGKLAEDLDPLSAIIAADSTWNLYAARRYDEALVQANRALALDPNFHATHRHLATIYDAKGMYKEALAAARKALAVNDVPGTRATLARALSKSGGRREAIKILADLEAESTQRHVPGMAMALAYAALGHKDKAFAWLEKDVAARTAPPAHFAVTPIWDDLRDDPRFADLIRRVEASKLE